MTNPAVVPTPDEEPDEQEEMDREERLFRQVMKHVTDQLWTAGVHDFALALLHDILGFVLSQQQVNLKCHKHQTDAAG
jgi:hypothetical protein